jgi:hypothetical protein
MPASYSRVSGADLDPETYTLIYISNGFPEHRKKRCHEYNSAATTISSIMH